MKIHEYQAAELMRAYGIPVVAGTVAETPKEVFKIASEMDGGCVIKAQIHSGGRGKAGGVKIARSPDEAFELAESLLGSTLVTKQTGPSGKAVRKVLVTPAVEIRQEYYAAVTMDINSAGLVLIASRAGGMDIETAANDNPDAVVHMPITLASGYHDYIGRESARRIGLPKEHWNGFIALVDAMVKLFLEKDCSLVEINPLVETIDAKLLALDAKINFENNALYRHPDCAAMRDPSEEDPKEAEASGYGLSYVSLDGNIGCMVNGAGLAMATMDIILKFGGMPANFLDIGGGAGMEKVKSAFKFLLSDSGVHVIYVNIFGGIMKCDVIAEGIIAAAREVDVEVPLIVRLEGTNADIAKKLLDESELDIVVAADMAEGAREACALAKLARRRRDNEYSHRR